MIDIRTSEYGSLGELLQHSNYVSSFENNEENFKVKLKNEIMKKDLFFEIANQNIDVDNFSVHRPDLNDIFVEYTKEINE